MAVVEVTVVMVVVEVTVVMAVVEVTVVMAVVEVTIVMAVVGVTVVMVVVQVVAVMVVVEVTPVKVVAEVILVVVVIVASRNKCYAREHSYRRQRQYAYSNCYHQRDGLVTAGDGRSRSDHGCFLRDDQDAATSPSEIALWTDAFVLQKAKHDHHDFY